MSYTPESIITTSDLGEHAALQPLLAAEDERHTQAFQQILARKRAETERAYVIAEQKSWSDWRLFRRLRAIRLRAVDHQQAERRRHEHAVIAIWTQANQ